MAVTEHMSSRLEVTDTHSCQQDRTMMDPLQVCWRGHRAALTCSEQTRASPCLECRQRAQIRLCPSVETQLWLTVPAPVKRDTSNNLCILKIIFLCFVLVFNLLNPQIQESSYGDYMADSVCIHVSSVLSVDAGRLCV